MVSMIFYTLLSPGRNDSKFCMEMSIMEVMSPLNILFVRVLSISNLFVVAICLLQGEQYIRLLSGVSIEGLGCDISVYFFPT